MRHVRTTNPLGRLRTPGQATLPEHLLGRRRAPTQQAYQTRVRQTRCVPGSRPLERAGKKIGQPTRTHIPHPFFWVYDGFSRGSLKLHLDWP
jgi:hypothetical protein